MKKTTGFVSVVGIGAALLIVGLLTIATLNISNKNSNKPNYEDYNYYSVIEPTDDNGNIGDHVKGASDAPVLIFEYADYQCPGCAIMNEKVNNVIDKLGGKVAVVYRSFLLSYHQNGTAAASAAEAAGLQGYWKEYADLLFANQDEWENSSGSERTEYFNSYFVEASNNKGDLDQFNADIASERVSKKISFDMGIARKVNIDSTPAFYVDGQNINWSDAGEITVNGKNISWDSSRGSEDDLLELFTEIAKAKLGE